MKNIAAKKMLSGQQMAIVQSELGKKHKEKLIAYLLWFFTGGIGGHRYYLGDYGYALAMTFTLGGLGVWTFIDLFFVGRRVERINDKIESRIIRKVSSM